MDDQKETSTQPLKPRFSKLAITTAVVVLICLVVCIFWPRLALPITIYIISIVLVGSFFSMMKRKGCIFPPPIIGFLIPILAILLAILMPAINKVNTISKRVVCGINIESIGTALIAHAGDYNNQLPDADKWCDLLITKADVSPRSLICPGSDTLEGESSYAININAVGKDIKKLPPDMVILFETDAGKEKEPRNTPVSKRASYPFLEKNDPKWVTHNKNQIVHANRWNQTGGPEIMALTHQLEGRPGCNVVYANGHPAFVCDPQLKYLRWTVDKPASKKSGDVK